MAQPPRPASVDDVRQHIVNSLFSRRAEDGTPEETLISFVKVFEEDPQDGPGGGQKTRYLMLAVTKLGKVVVHKAKRNNNLSFSKGKTWHLEDVRVLEVISPTSFALTMTIRRYVWETERPKDQQHFLGSVIKVYKTYTKGQTPELIGWEPPPGRESGTSSPMDNRRPSNQSSSSPLPRNIDLAPPQAAFKTQRSGSSSSFASGSSLYNGGSDSGLSTSRSRPSFDEQRTPTAGQFSRSPLADSGVGVPKRPVPSPAAPPVNGGGGGIGMGPPPKERQGNGLRDRDASAASEYAAEAPSRPERGRDRVNGKPKPSPLPTQSQLAPTITHTLPSPAMASDPTFPSSSRSLPQPQPQPQPPPSSTSESAIDLESSAPEPKREPAKPRRRASFHPPPLDTAFSREVLLTSRTGVLPGKAGLTVQGGNEAGEAEDATLGNVEELLEGFDWGAGALGEEGKKRSGGEAIESRLVDELAALDSANIHAFLESDDRIAQVLGHIDEALAELDDIDMQITGYRMQLNAVSEDISYIESQNRGLQVQTSNQQALLDEMRQLLQIVEVPQNDLRVLTQESPGTQRGVQALEQAAASLYKALQAGRDSANAEVQATIARMREYQENSAQFCKRMGDYLDVTFKYQSDQSLAEFRKAKTRQLQPHTSMGEYLMMYEGLVLYVKEMDEERYQRICSNYMSTISQLHQSEIKDVLMQLMGPINASAGGEVNDASFASAAASNAPKTSALQRGRAVVGLKNEAGKAQRSGGSDNSGKIAESYKSALTQIISQVLVEEDFINAFLHLSDTESTFADHMQLDSYFRRQAARHASRQMGPGLTQLVRSMMDLVFGFVEGEMRQWTEAATQGCNFAIVGVLATTERLAMEAEEENTSMFFAQLFDRQLARQRAAFDAFINDQIRTIDAAKNSTKRRRGVTFFVRHFPAFVEKLESQLADDDASALPIRQKVNEAYERVAHAVFASLQQIAKMDKGEGQSQEDKGALNFHVIMIENMHHFVEDVSHLGAPALAVSLERAKGMYQENMGMYVKMLLRRSFGRMMDFFDGIERLLQSTPANEVSLHGAYSRPSLKKVLKDVSAKDMRKAIDAMAKRVDKHFLEEGGSVEVVDAGMQAVVAEVWREITAELKREVSRAEGLIKASYGDANVGLDFGPGDVEAACKRVK